MPDDRGLDGAPHRPQPEAVTRVTSPFSVFKSSNLWTDCEQCRLRVNLSNAGACAKCKRILCDTHLHGSFARKLIVDLGVGAVICLKCRQP